MDAARALISFPNTYRRIRTMGSVSHAWIELHRLVEAYCRTMGGRFSAVFAELEGRYGFAREDPARWPDLATIRAAADDLQGRRQARLDARARLVAARRRAKAAGRRGPPPPELVALETIHGPCPPRVGFWGWRRRRRGAARDGG